MRFQHLFVGSLLALAFNLASGSVGQEPSASATAMSLKDAVDERFKIGVGVSEQILSDQTCSELICKHFQILTPENCMKPQGVHPAEAEWNFDAPDRFVAYARRHGLGDNTHNILWRMRNGELDRLSTKTVVLQAGTNHLPWDGVANQNTIGDVGGGIADIIHEFQQRVPKAVIVLTALFPRDPNAADAPAIEEINARLRSLANRRRVRFININTQLTDSQGKFLPGYSAPFNYTFCPTNLFPFIRGSKCHRSAS